MRGIDCAAPLSRDQLVQARDLGIEVLMRYYRLDDNDPTRLQQKEVDAWLALGGAIVPIFEHSGRPEDGALVGGAITLSAARLRQPSLTPVVVAADYDVPAADFDAWLAYLNDIIARTSAAHIPLWLYGPADLLLFAARNWPAVTGLYRAYAPAWSGGRNSVDYPEYDVVQIANGVTFLDTIVDLDVFRTSARLWRA